MAADPARKSAWRFFPWYLAAGMGFVMVVNFGLGWMAVKTFPGLATAHGFTDSNGYDRILATAAKQAALGWEVRATVESSRPVVTLTDRDGAPLAGARVEGEAERPLGDAPPVRLAFTPTTPGRFEADRALAPGNWEIDLTVTAEGGVFHATRRLIAR